MQPEALRLDADIQDAISSSILKANEIAGPVRGVVTVLVDDDARVRELNKLWRDIDKPTNVLSFPYPEGPPGPDRCIGDIAISYETAAREAAADGLPLAHHLAHLSVHGFLHLLGYDHESDREADAMERLERDILAHVDVPDPYTAREAKG
ncbi:MAG: rRNA maturation RNase YbeY [Xanthobacteraceae bacterium]